MWINLRTEYSFRKVYGQIPQVLAQCTGHHFAGIADLYNTWGHYQWCKLCDEAGIKPLLGVVLLSSETPGDKHSPTKQITLIARNNAGLEEIYRAVGKAYEHTVFRYRQGHIPHYPMDDVGSLSSDVVVLLPEDLLRPNSYTTSGVYAGLDNYYPAAGDRDVWQLVVGKENCEYKETPQHILTQDEWLAQWRGQEHLFESNAELAKSCSASLQKSPMVRFTGSVGIGDLCAIGAKERGVDLSLPEYKARLERELGLIKEKDYEDYFLIVADMVRYAKRHMLVGPSRGSSAGSLVCYLVGITEVDPLQHGLLFERFIDINRKDLPDIDIDFPDSKRQIVVNYMRQKYGIENVAHIGTVSRFKPKSAIGEFAKQLLIPEEETQEVKDAIIERSTGDARSAQCIEDTLASTDVGKSFIQKYPQMALVQRAEGHARHPGVHAAGIVVCNLPITSYVGTNGPGDTAMVEKNDAEALGLLKIDALGLRTLSILEDVCDMIGKPYSWVYTLPLDDEKAFGIFNSMRLSGVFQFEGYALRSLTRQMGVHEFNDIVAITALARPGPLHCGGATTFIQRRTGKEETEYLSQHPAVVEITKENYGTIIYQEDVMMIGREYGGLSWEDVSSLRKAMSKSLGEEFFNKYKERFLEGTRRRDVDDDEAVHVWDSMCTFGSWAFNKSHAVSYGLISYWTAYMKAHYPLEFAMASLNNARDEESAKKFLRDMVKNEGVEYAVKDPRGLANGWCIRDRKLIAPLTTIHGIGERKAEQIMKRIDEGEPLTEHQKKLLTGECAFEDLFPAETRFGEVYRDPYTLLRAKYNISVSSRVSYIEDVQENGTHLFIGRLVDRNLRDLNEYGNVVKRGGRLIKGNSLFLNITLEDDTDAIICTIDRYRFPKMGKPIAESGKLNRDWYLVKGEIRNSRRKIYVKNIMRL